MAKIHYRTIWISNAHLCSRDCRAGYLLSFLKCCKSEYLYIVGDFIDVWQLKRRWYGPQMFNNTMTGASRILLLSMKAGAGHIRAAAAIEQAMRLKAPHAEIKHLECLSLMSAPYRFIFTESYAVLLRWSPSLWRVLYERTEHGAVDSRMKCLSSFLAHSNALRLEGAIREFSPDVVVCTHFIPAAANLAGEPNSTKQ